MEVCRGNDHIRVYFSLLSANVGIHDVCPLAWLLVDARFFEIFAPTPECAWSRRELLSDDWLAAFESNCCLRQYDAFLNTLFSFIAISHHLLPDFSRFLVRLVAHRDVGNRSFLVWFVPINATIGRDRGSAVVNNATWRTTSACCYCIS